MSSDTINNDVTKDGGEKALLTGRSRVVRPLVLGIIVLLIGVIGLRVSSFANRKGTKPQTEVQKGVSELPSQIADQLNGVKITICETSVKAIRDAAHLYNIKTGKFPTSIADLVVKDSEGVSYLEENAPLDPWGNDYKFEMNGKKFVVVSAGPDSKFDTEDDIRSDKAAKQ